MAHPTRILFAALLLVASSLPAIADTVNYQFTLDTTSQSGNYGYIDLGLNPGPLGGAQPIYGDIYDLSGATLNPSDPLNAADTFGTTGSLPDSLSMANSAPNNYLEGLTFGTTLTFDLTLSGSGVSLAGNATSTTDTTFAVTFYDATISNTLFTVDPDTGAAALIDIDTSGTPTATGDLTVSPEPTSLRYLMCAGLAALLSAVRLRRSSKTVI